MGYRQMQDKSLKPKHIEASPELRTQLILRILQYPRQGPAHMVPSLGDLNPVFRQQATIWFTSAVRWPTAGCW